MREYYFWLNWIKFIFSIILFSNLNLSVCSYIKDSTWVAHILEHSSVFCGKRKYPRLVTPAFFLYFPHISKWTSTTPPLHSSQCCLIFLYFFFLFFGKIAMIPLFVTHILFPIFFLFFIFAYLRLKWMNSSKGFDT